MFGLDYKGWGYTRDSSTVFLMNPSYQKKKKKPQQGLYSIYPPMPQTERVSATGTRRIKLNLCTRVKFLQNGLKRYSPNSSYIFILRVCLEFA